MRWLQVSVLLLMAAGALAGQAKPAKGDDKKLAAKQEEVAPDDFVVLLTGACQTAPLEFAVRDCVRGVTRQEFEDLLKVAAPNASPETKQLVANDLAKIIILSNEAKKLGLPKDPGVKQYLRFIEMQALADLLLRQTLRAEAAKQVTDEAVASYYAKHADEFAVAEFLRINIPRRSGEVADAAAQFAESLRARCAAGEDPNTLQAEADRRADQKEVQAADLKNQRRAGYGPKQQNIFSLKPGECAVESADPNQPFVYKMVAATTMPLEQARASIVTALESEYVKSRMDELAKQNVANFNHKYFPDASGAWMPEPAQGANPK